MPTRGVARSGVSWDTLFGLMLGVVAFLYLSHEWSHSVVYQLYGDSVHYNLSARTMLSKHFYTYWGHGPDAQVTPGYPLFLAVCYLIGGHISASPHAGIHVAFFIQMLLAAATACVLYWISRRVLNRFWSFVVGFIWTIYPTTHGSYGHLLTEALYVPLLCAYVWLLLIAMERRRVVWWFVSGLTLGLGALVRPTVLPLILAAAIVLLLGVSRAKARNRGASLAENSYRFLLHLIGFLIPLVPWWVRNWEVFHRILLTDTDAGNPLLFGSDPNFAHDPTLGRGLTATQQEHLAIHNALHGFAVHPLTELMWYTIDKLGLLFGSPWLVENVPFAHVQPILVIIGAMGLLFLLWRPGLRLVSLITIYLLLTQLPFLPLPRYAFPMMPFFFIGIGFFLQWLVEVLQNRGRPRRANRRTKSEERTA